MSSKRNFDETDSAMHPDQARMGKRFKHAGDPTDSHRRSSTYNNAKNSKHKGREGTMNWTKKRARTIERSLRRVRDNLPADKAQDLKRELESHRSAVQESEYKKQRSKMIKKYHMVRFFERKKAERLQKQLRKRLANATGDDEIAALTADIHIAEVDKLYTVYFPYLERYTSLYPVAKNENAEKSESTLDEKSAAELALRSERPPMWASIEEAAAKGEEFLETIRDRQPETPIDDPSTTAQPSRSKLQGSSIGKGGKAKSLSRAVQGKDAPRGGKTPAPHNDRKANARTDLVKDDWRKSKDEDSGDDEEDGGFFDFGPSKSP